MAFAPYINSGGVSVYNLQPWIFGGQLSPHLFAVFDSADHGPGARRWIACPSPYRLSSSEIEQAGLGKQSIHKLSNGVEPPVFKDSRHQALDR
jgi:hypothetical protein